MSGQLSLPYADVLPPLATKEREALEADVRADGVHAPLLVTEDGVLLDGHNRYSVDPEAPRKVLPGSKEWSDAHRRAFVLGTATKTRNLTPDQQRYLDGARKSVAAELKAEGWTQERIGVLLGVAQQTVADWLHVGSNTGAGNPSALDSRVKVSKPAKAQLVERVAAGESTAQIAADLGVTDRRVRQIAAEAEKKKRSAEVASKPAAPVGGKFGLIYADPPWRYEHVKTDSRAIENQYPTMSLEEICALKVPAADDCVLYLWATSPKLAESMQVVTAWGFTYRTCMVWVKDKIGMGYYARQRHELLLIATRGSPGTPEESVRPDSVIEAPRGRHSAKPELVYGLLEALYPALSRVELFARGQREGWAAWGNQADAP